MFFNDIGSMFLARHAEGIVTQNCHIIICWQHVEECLNANECKLLSKGQRHITLIGHAWIQDVQLTNTQIRSPEVVNMAVEYSGDVSVSVAGQLFVVSRSLMLPMATSWRCAVHPLNVANLFPENRHEDPHEDPHVSHTGCF